MDGLAIDALGLGKRYGDIWGLRDATFDVPRGMLAVLVGPNGAGKTTTVGILTTVLKPTKGRARVLGLDVVAEHKRLRRLIAYLPQEYGVYLDLTPMEAVAWHLVARGWPIRDAKAQARRYLELLDMWDVRDRTGWKLSGGQRHKMAVAMCLATEADLMFLDEPTVRLDVESKHAVWGVLREMVAEGHTVLLTTHDMSEAETIADRVILIDGGRTIAVGRPNDFIGMLPYEYKVMVKKEGSLDVTGHPTVEIGDRIAIYAKKHEEAVKLVEELSRRTVIHLVDRVGLEDAYLFLIKRGGGPDEGD